MVTGVSTGMGTGADYGGAGFYGPSGGASSVSGHSRTDRIAQQAQEAKLAALKAQITLAKMEAIRQQGAAGATPTYPWGGNFYAPSENIYARLNSVTGWESPAELAALARAEVADQWALQQNHWQDEKAYAAYQARQANMAKEEARRKRMSEGPFALGAYFA